MRQIGYGGIATIVGVLGAITVAHRIAKSDEASDLSPRPAVEAYQEGIFIYEGNLPKSTNLGDIARDHLFVTYQDQEIRMSGEMGMFNEIPSTYAVAVPICYDTTLEDELRIVPDIYSETLNPEDDRKFFCRIEYLSPA